jgi:hypothetical protein
MATRTKKAAVAKTAGTKPETAPDKRTVDPHEVVLSPEIQSAVAIKAWGAFAGEVDLAGLVKEQREQFKQVHGGDMQPVESMLFSQAKTLETIFTNLARRAAAQESIQWLQALLGLALKAQAQSRATLAVLAEVKNPRPVAFVKQANISSGPQQVNNGLQPAQKDGSAQLGGAVECLQAPEGGTAQYPTRTFFSPLNQIQQTPVAATAARTA